MIVRLVCLLFVGAIVLCTPSSRAQPVLDRSRSVYMDADKLGYDQKNAIVMALGNVRIVQGQSELFADRITYFQQQNVVRADGNVRVEDHTTGETYYATQVQLQDDLKRGVVSQFRVRLTDNSQFAAAEARRLSETKTRLRKAVYSPCEVCEDESPFWQLKADQVDIDEKDQQVRYENAMLELKGLPVAYAPYFSHPTPDADAKTGFLRPEYSQNSNLGSILRTPYYLSIAPDKDATITPMFTSEEGPVLVTEYRQLFDAGFLQLDGSITYPYERDDTGRQLDNRELRGHIYASGMAALNSHWSAGFDIRRTTDDTYLRRYGFGAPRSLTSRIFSEGLYGRNYAIIEGLTFQGLDANDNPDTEPYVIPLARGYTESDAGLWGVQGLRHFSAASLQVIARQEQTQSRRLSVTNGLQWPMVSDGGHLFDATLQNRLDLYSVENLSRADQKDFNGEEVRAIPTAALKWRYPLQRAIGSGSLTIEPTVLAVARPSGGNPAEIPNEDNRIVEFSDVNLFAIDPFPGLDTVDEGSRLAYGIRGHWWLGGPRDVFFSLGQNISAEADTPFPYNDEPNEHFSDYVGRLALDYDPFSLSYRFRLDQDNFHLNNQSIGVGTNLHPVQIGLDYITLEDDIFLDNREEIVGFTSIALSDQWTVHANARRDLLLNNMLFAGGGLTYHNECFTLDAAFSRAFVRDRDLEPDNQFSIRVGFRNLTELQ